MKYVKSLLIQELDKHESFINQKLEQIQDLVNQQQKLEDQLIPLNQIQVDLIKALEALDE